MPIAEGFQEVRPDGPLDAKVAFVGERPGLEEIRQGRGFVGKSGEVLWTLTEKYAGLDRPDIWVTNLVKSYAGGENPNDAEVAAWGPLLDQELAALPNLELVVPLGLHSTRWLLGPQATMEQYHGIAWPKEQWLVLPSFHPAAGLYDPKQLAMTAYDLEMVGKAARGNPPLRPVDPYGKPDYRKIKWTELPDFPVPVVAIDTEGSKWDPWSLQFSYRPGQGHLIEVSDTHAMGRFFSWLEHTKPLLVFHYALHDLGVIRNLGYDLVKMGLRIADTMVIGGQLRGYKAEREEGERSRGSRSLGLKSMAFRLAGMEMRNWADVVGPHEDRLVKTYFAKVQARESQWPAGVGRKQGIARRVKNCLTSRAAEPITLREGWERIEPELRRPVEEALGPLPELRYRDVKGDPEFLRYACRDPDATLRLYQAEKPLMREQELVPAIALDTAIIPIVDEMQRNGMPADRARFAALSSDLKQRADAILELIRWIAGSEEFNPASGDQVAEWCRQEYIKTRKCGLTRMTKAKLREEVGEEALLGIVDDHPMIQLILDWKSLNTLDTRYASKVPKMLDVNDLYHPEFRMVNVASGRLAEFILTFPARSEDGRKIRSGFVAPPGWRFGSADLSQIELRLAAVLGEDANMTQAFLDGADLHTRTAALLFGIPDEQVDKLTQRMPIKTINFRILYGGDDAKSMTRKLLSVGVKTQPNGKSLDLAYTQGLIDNWFLKYAGVKRFMVQCADECRRLGYSSSKWGRRRYIPAIYLPDNRWFGHLRKEAERQAGNFPIQTTAQELIKRAMVRFYYQSIPRLTALGIECRILLQYHDELVVMFKIANEEEVKKELMWAMTADSHLFPVPIISEWASGQDWGQLKD